MSETLKVRSYKHSSIRKSMGLLAAASFVDKAKHGEVARDDTDESDEDIYNPASSYDVGPSTTRLSTALDLASRKSEKLTSMV